MGGGELTPRLLGPPAPRAALHEKEHFGLRWNCKALGVELWLSMEKKVVDQVSLTRGEPLKLTFAVRCYVSDVAFFNEFITQKLFFLDAARLVGHGELVCSGERAVQLAALALQALKGDVLTPSATRSEMVT